MKKQYGILQALRVAMHPAKTFIGKVKKGFDFLRVNLTPTGVTVSDTALSRHEQKVARLYEQGAKPKRIRAYRLRWLVWGTIGVFSCVHGSMLDTSGECNVDPANGCAAPHSRGTAYHSGACISSNTATTPLGAEFTIFSPGENLRQCFSTTPPTNPLTTTPCNSTAGETDNITNYLLLENTTLGTFCAYSYVVDVTNSVANQRRTNAAVFTPAAPTSIPAYGPFAYMASLLGILWFARRRKRKSCSS